MTLQAIALQIDADVRDTTESEMELINASEKRTQGFLRRSRGVTALLRSDPHAFCRSMRMLRCLGILQGHSFCEWGSGIGTMTALAALSGFDAYGIEREAAFIAEARALCCDFSLAASFVCGSFVPPQIAERFSVVGTYGATDWSITMGLDVYGVLGRRCSEMDLIYAYPWPREITLYEQLFDLTAKKEAVLWLHRQGERPSVMIKT